MTIYATPYNNRTKKCTGPSADSGFESLDQVAAMMGEPIKTSPKMLIYGGDTDRIVYSTFVFTLWTHDIRPIDGVAIKA